MHQEPLRVRARVRGRCLELLDDVHLPEGRELTVAVTPSDSVEATRITLALAESAGAWSDDAHPELMTRDDVIAEVEHGRTRFDRRHGL